MTEGCLGFHRGTNVVLDNIGVLEDLYGKSAHIWVILAGVGGVHCGPHDVGNSYPSSTSLYM